MKRKPEWSDRYYSLTEILIFKWFWFVGWVEGKINKLKLWK